MRSFHAIPATAPLAVLASCLILLGCGVDNSELEPASAYESGSLEGSTEPSAGVEYWRGVRRDFRDGSEAPIEVEVEPILDSRGRLERLKIGSNEDPYLGLAVELFDPQTKIWQRYYSNNVTLKFIEMIGEARGERTIWHRSKLEDSRRSRMVSERIEPDRWRRTQSVSDDGGRTWTVLWEDELQRVADRR